MNPRVGGYVPQGLTTLPMLLITFFSLSIPTFFSLFVHNIFEFSWYVGSELVVYLMFPKNLSQKAMLLKTDTHTHYTLAIQMDIDT